METIHIFLVQALRLAMQQIHNLEIERYNTYLTKSMSGGEKNDIVFNVANNLGHSIGVSRGTEDDNGGDEAEFDGVELVESSPNND
ncbi:hypothetical protein CR513_57250, partial [Mucuna pruriens]